MKSKLEEIVTGIRASWGPLQFREANYAIGLFNSVVGGLLPDPHQEHFGRTISMMVIDFLRAKGVNSSSAHLELADIIGPLEAAMGRGTALYVLTGYWAHHAPSEETVGTQDDYCEHQAFSTPMLFDDYADARSAALEALRDRIVPTLPNPATDAKVELDMFDGDHLIPLGEWNWNKYHFDDIGWTTPERH